MNYYAALYLDFAKRFEAPLDAVRRNRKVRASEQSRRGFHSTSITRLGTSFGAWRVRGTYATIRCASAASRACAAPRLLTAQLRERGVPLERMAAEAEQRRVANPFDGEPFEWSAEEQAVVYIGPDAERTRKRHPYFYSSAVNT